MSNIHIILNAYEAEAYYSTDDSVRKPAIVKALAQAQRLANETGRGVEIHHPDGFMVEYIGPDPYADIL